MSSRTLKPIFQRGGSKRQKILDQAVEMLASRSGGTQQDKMHFCMTNLGMDATEYLECLNTASNGGVVKSALWNKFHSLRAPQAPGQSKKKKKKDTSCKRQATSLTQLKGIRFYVSKTR